ncbi:MAG: saccharopine dehydrogenase NADP-binding domain-containing protein [Pseudomonadota bacterium]
MTNTILIVGGYGVFGGFLAKALTADPTFDVIVAGRSLEKANAHCAEFGGRALKLDINDSELDDRLAALAPSVVVDAAGPFQTYGDEPYRMVKAALRSGAHYLDLSDDAEFTKGISRFDAEARQKHLTAVSGASSVPALSSAVVHALSDGLSQIETIDMAIVPGNRAPRGISVIRAIIGQAGRPMRVWQNKSWITVTGWSELTTLNLRVAGTAPLKGRWASNIGSPDLELFPEYFSARTVRFKAGLELKTLHGGLALLSLPVRMGWVPSLAPLAPVVKWIADRLEFAGSDRGGMVVSVTGTTPNERLSTRRWTLIAEAGDGPRIPAIPAEILCRKLVHTTSVEPGARPCLCEFTLDEADLALKKFAIVTQTDGADG